MSRLIAFGLLFFGAAADAGLRGTQHGPAFDTLFGKSQSSENVDPMDMYIKDSKSDDSGSKVWFSNSGSQKKSDSIFDHPSTQSVFDHSSSLFDHASFSDSIFKSSHSSDMDSIFKSSSHSSDTDSTFKSSRSSDMDSIFKSSHSSDMDSIFKPSSRSSDTDSTFKSSRSSDTDSIFKSSRQSSDTDSTAKSDRSSLADDKVDMFAGSKEAREPSIAMPHSAGGDSGASNGGGVVVDIKLDSELQESQSFLQSGKKGLRSGSAPDVEKAVQSQRLEDVYIHDQFSEAAAADVQKEQEVNANRDMKAA